MNMALEFSTVSKSAHLSPEQTEEFTAVLNRFDKML